MCAFKNIRFISYSFFKKNLFIQQNSHFVHKTHMGCLLYITFTTYILKYHFIHYWISIISMENILSQITICSTLR